MKRHTPTGIAGVILASATVALLVAGTEGAAAQASDIEETVSSGGVAPKLQLSAAQRSAIYQAVQKDRCKAAPGRFATNVGSDVPPMIELYPLPDDVLAQNPVTRLYKFIRVEDQVVLVDPTQMRVIAVIGPKATP
jgi:hypothetical protein